MKGPAKVSVVIPTYNRGGVVTDAIDSVRGQTFQDFEIIIVDDGSTDNTEARVRKIRDPRIACTRQPRGGVSAARNAGVLLARGQLVSFLDSDDLWKSDKLASDLEFLATHSEAAAVFSDADRHHGARYARSFIGETLVFSRKLGRAVDPHGCVLDPRAMFLCLLEEVPIATITFTVRRAAFDRAGGFDERWTCFEDWEFFLRFARKFRLGFVPRALATIRISEDSLHVVQAGRGRSAMFHRLLEERSLLDDDPDAVAAATRGIARLSVRLAWHHAERGHRLAAMASCLRGYRATREPGLLLRAGAIWIPTGVRRAARRVASRVSAAPRRPLAGGLG